MCNKASLISAPLCSIACRKFSYSSNTRPQASTCPYTEPVVYGPLLLRVLPLTEYKLGFITDLIQNTMCANTPTTMSHCDGRAKQKNGHKEDILCVVHCPPSLLATGSYDGEILVWNVVSGCIQCRFVSPTPAEYQNVQGLNTSVPSMIFLKLQQFSSATVLISSGAMGFLNLWNVVGGGKFVSSFKASKFQQNITKLAKSEKETLLYAADQIGYIFVYNMEQFAPEQKSPRAENFWRAHTSTITGLQIVDSDQVVLTSSADYTVRLWSAHGEFIGTFGQTESWSVHISSSWMHPAVPYEVLIDPLSMPDHKILNVKTHLSDAINPDKTEADRGELESEMHSKLRLLPESISDTDIEED